MRILRSDAASDSWLRLRFAVRPRLWRLRYALRHAVRPFLRLPAAAGAWLRRLRLRHVRRWMRLVQSLWLVRRFVLRRSVCRSLRLGLLWPLLAPRSAELFIRPVHALHLVWPVLRRALLGRFLQ